MSNPPPSALPSVEVLLKDGSIAQLRPLGNADRPLIEEGLAAMSAQSRLARFGAAIDHLTDAELDYLTDIDLVNHVAWGATIAGAPAASGRYIRPVGSVEAELAIAVVDRFQRRGLGKALFDALMASARQNGVGRLYFSVQPGNVAVLGMLDRVGAVLHEDQGLLVGHLDVADLGEAQDEDRFRALLELYQGSRSPSEGLRSSAAELMQ